MFCSNVWHALYVEKSDVKFTYITYMYFILKLKPKPQIFNFRQKYDNFDGVT